MQKQTLRMFAVAGMVATGLSAQNLPRQATIVGGGSPDRGKCTIEVVVDIVAQVEIRGTSANLRTMGGQPAQWRRFECNSPMPPNPVNFRFQGVDGRGRQSLVRDPSNGGPAVVEIEDKDGGSEGYTFDITWGGGGGGGGYQDRGGPPGPPPGGDRGRPDDRGGRPEYRDGDYYRRYGHAFGTDEAVRVCQDSIMTQASRRFRSRDIHFHDTQIDDKPGRNDWVVGSIDIHRGPREERYGFSCSVDFSSGRVRSADLDTRPLPEDRWRH